MKKSWLIGGVLVGCTMGASIGACGSSSSTGTGASGPTTSGTLSTTTSSSSTSGTPTSTTSVTASSTTSGTPTSSTTTTSGGGSTTTTSSGGGSTSTSTSTSSSGCENPSTLHPPQAVDAGFPDFYCPFANVGDAGYVYCPGGGTQECCETPADAGVPSSCLALGSSSCPANSTIWGCDDPGECPTTNPVCCGNPYSGKAVTINETAGCTNYYASDMAGTSCVASASDCTTAGGVIMCTSDAECTIAGMTTCQPFRKAGNSVGACQ